MANERARAIEAVSAPGAVIGVGPGCGTPTTLLQLVADHADVTAPAQLWAGLLLGDVPLDAFQEGAIELHTWHVTRTTRQLIADGLAAFHPLRGSDVPAALARRGLDTALVRVTPPDRHGFVSLGTSVSYTRAMTATTPTVLGEVDEAMPRTAGDSLVHRSRFAALVATESPTPEYEARTPGTTAQRIANNLIPLLPPNPCVQLGIGEIPEAVTGLLGDTDLGSLRCIGMGNDAMVDLFDRGVLDHRQLTPEPAIAAVELMGSRRLLDHAHDNPAIGVYPVDHAGDPGPLGKLDRFVSINSAVEVDLLGQVSAEWAAGRQLSSIGGSVDFSEAARASRGGLRIIAISARGRDASRITARFQPGTPVSLTRTMVDFVVTEHGVAELRGASVEDRRERLIAIADPDDRDHLAATSRELVAADARGPSSSLPR